MDRPDFFETAYPAESSGLNVHRLRAMLNSEHFVADCAATLRGAQSGRRPLSVGVASVNESGLPGVKSGSSTGSLVVGNRGPAQSIAYDFALGHFFHEVSAKARSILFKFFRRRVDHSQRFPVALLNVGMGNAPAFGDGWRVGISDGAITLPASRHGQNAPSGGDAGPCDRKNVILGPGGIPAVDTNPLRVVDQFGDFQSQVLNLGAHLGFAFRNKVGKMRRRLIMVMRPKSKDLILVASGSSLPGSAAGLNVDHVDYNIPPHSDIPHALAETGALGAQIDVQPLHDLSDALSEVGEIEQWWDEPHCESPHRPGTPNCSHVPVARFSCGCEPGRGTIRVCANAAEYARSCIDDGYVVCECGALCRDCWMIEWL